MKAIIFARGNDIQKQIEDGKEHALRKGYTVEGVVVGHGRDLPAVIDGLGIKIDRVIASNMARITRNAREGYLLESDLEFEHGVLIEIVENERRNDLQDKLMKNLIRAIRENDAR